MPWWLPCCCLSSTRRSDWIQKVRLSPKAAFHSATLLIAGLYLLFISGVGYYVRYFGGDWGWRASTRSGISRIDRSDGVGVVRFYEGETYESWLGNIFFATVTTTGKNGFDLPMPCR